MNGNIIRTITIRGTSEGLDKLQTDLTKLAAAHKGVAIAAEETDKKTISLEQAWKRQTLRLDEVARAQHNLAREMKIPNQMLQEGRISQEQHARQLELINQRYATTAQGAQTYGKALQQGTGEARLARHEMINLSRQIQDVGVSLASGQAPLTVLVQQGSQIADVFATSAGTIGGFFRQVGTGAARFLTSAAGMATGAAAIGTALVVVGSNYASAQRDIEKGLSGIGAASGVTRDQINQIAEATSSWSGASVSQAREAATAFAATGKIQAENVGLATKVIDNYVRAGGDAADMTKTLAAAMQDPAKAALELNKSYGFLNVATLENIRNLQAQGKEQEAAKALLEALNPAIQKQAQTVSIWGLAWNVTTNAISAATDALGKYIARQGERATGANLGGFTDEERLGRARERVSGLQERIGQAAAPQSVLDYWNKALKTAQEEVARLEQALKSGGSAFDLLGIQAKTAADGFLPLQAQIEATQQQLAKLREYEAAGGYVDPQAIQAGELRKKQLIEQEAALTRQNAVIQQIADKYPGMSVEVAKQLDALNGQLQVAQARTGAEQMVAQELATQNSLRGQGLTLEERQAIAAKQREIAEANVSKAIADQIHSLNQQIELSKARIAGTQASVAAEQAHANAVRQGASAFEAQAVASATRRANAQQKEEEAFNRTGQSQARALNTVQEYNEAQADASDQLETIDNQTQSIGSNYSSWNQYAAAYNAQMRQAVALMADLEYKWANIPNIMFHINEYMQVVMYGMAPQIKLWTDAITGQYTQFNPEGYGVSYDPLGNERRKKAYEEQGIPYKVETSISGLQRVVRDYGDTVSDLTSSNEDLTASTDSLNATMQNALSPFYSQDPRTTKLGFRAGVTGNSDWTTGATNENPLVAVLGYGATAPGMANGGSFTVGGGYSANDNRMAVFPVASGEEVVVNRSKQQAAAQVVNIDNRIIITGSVDRDTLSQMKVSRYQQAQRMRAGLRG